MKKNNYFNEYIIIVFLLVIFILILFYFKKYNIESFPGNMGGSFFSTHSVYNPPINSNNFNPKTETISYRTDEFGRNQLVITPMGNAGYGSSSGSYARPSGGSRRKNHDNKCRGSSREIILNFPKHSKKTVFKL